MLNSLDKKPKLNIIDYAIGVLLIFIFSWNPNFAHGYITGLDEGLHLVWINQILLGKIPYKDIYMVWGPFSEWLPVLFMKIMGISLTSFRLFYHLSRLLTIILGFIVLKQFLKTRLFVYICLWVLVVTKVSDFWSARWGSTRLLFALLAIYMIILYIKNNKKHFLLFSGIFSSIALFNSQESGIISISVIVLFLFLFNRYLRNELKIDSLGNVLLLYLSGIIIIALPIFIYFIFNGALADFIKVYFVDIFTAYATELVQTKLSLSLLKAFYLFPNSFFTIRLSYFLISAGVFFVGCIYLFVSFIFKKIGEDELKLCLIIPFGVLFLLTASRQIDGEQLFLCSPMIIVVALFILEKIFVWSKKRRNIFLKMICTFFLISLFVYFFIKSDSWNLIKETAKRYVSLKQSSQERFHNFIYGSSHPVEITARLTGNWQGLNIERARGVYVPREQAETVNSVVEFIEKNTSSDEPILVFPHEGQYYFLTNRMSATRIIPLVYVVLRPEYQEETLEDLERTKPHYCIYVQDAQIVPRAKGNLPNELLLNSIYKYIVDNYRIIRRYNNTFILERISFLK